MRAANVGMMMATLECPAKSTVRRADTRRIRVPASAPGVSVRGWPMHISLPTLLLVLFIGLKLTGYITWPWLWVLSPLWIPILALFAFYAVIFGVAALTFIIAWALGTSRGR